MKNPGKPNRWSEGTIFLTIGLYLILLIVGSCAFLFLPFGHQFITWLDDPNSSSFAFYKLSSHVFLAGLLGGAFFATRKLIDRMTMKHESEDQLPLKSWFFWYMFRPIQGGVLSLIILSMLNAGFLGFADMSSPKTHTMYFQISIGFMVGYGTQQVTKKIDEIIKTIFISDKGKSDAAEQKADQ